MEIENALRCNIEYMYISDYGDHICCNPRYKGCSGNKASRDEIIKKYNEVNKKLILKNIFFTSYNAEVGQTDSTPCIAGGTGYNVCEMYKNNERVIALSQELIQWSMYGKNGPFKKGDKVILESTDFPDDWRCNGEFIVGDAMNARYRKRGDIFMLHRKDNISCHANIYRII